MKFANPLGVWIGWACGMMTATTVAFSGQELFGLKLFASLPRFSFQYIGPSSLAVNLIVGTAACWLISRLRPRADSA